MLLLKMIGGIVHTILLLLFTLSVLPFIVFSTDATFRLSLMLTDQTGALADLRAEWEAKKRRVR